MAQLETPVTQQRRLRAELKRAREQSGMTQRDVAQALDWSPSKVIRIETGAVIISTSDLRALLPHYGITDRKRVESLVEVGRASRTHAWWDAYRPYYDRQLVTFLAYGASTIRPRSYQAQLIPGQLQTQTFPDAIVRARTNDVDEFARGVEGPVAGSGVTAGVISLSRSRVGSAHQHQRLLEDAIRSRAIRKKPGPLSELPENNPARMAKQRN